MPIGCRIYKANAKLFATATKQFLSLKV